MAQPDCSVDPLKPQLHICTTNQFPQQQSQTDREKKFRKVDAIGSHWNGCVSVESLNAAEITDRRDGIALLPV